MSQTLRSTFNRVMGRENRRAVVRTGRIEHIHGFESQILGNARELTIYLPPGYDEREDRRYPVLLMQDGQNLFEPERAFIPGQHWTLREAADGAIHNGADPMIIVGIDNAGAARIDEYTSSRDEGRNAGGRAADYARFLLEELRPRIESSFRILPHDLGVGGSSLGGLLTMHLALEYPDAFRRAAVMSPSVWWNGRAILGEVDAFAGTTRPRLWLDIGGREGREALFDARMLRDRLMAKGWVEGDDLRYYEDRRADHSERAWAERVRIVLEFLYPATT